MRGKYVGILPFKKRISIRLIRCGLLLAGPLSNLHLSRLSTCGACAIATVWLVDTAQSHDEMTAEMDDTSS